MDRNIKIMANNAAVDAAIITKDECFPGLVDRFGIPLEKIAVIGDEKIDLPMLSISGLGFIGAPANAQSEVREYVSGHGGHVSGSEAYNGFEDFYAQCRDRGIELIVSDKDGVLKQGGDISGGPRFSKLALDMGNDGNPYVTVLTGSSLAVNQEFRTAYGLDERLLSNSAVVDHPYLLLVESGAIHVNVLDGGTENYVHEIEPDLLSALKGDFETRVAGRIESEIFPEFGFRWSAEYGDQQAAIFHDTNKQSMVTFNVPRQRADGQPFRKTDDAGRYREGVVGIMKEEADGLGLGYEVL